MIIETLLRVEDMYTEAQHPAPLGSTGYTPMIS